jgi:hypothetical protein
LELIVVVDCQVKQLLLGLEVHLILLNQRRKDFFHILVCSMRVIDEFFVLALLVLGLPIELGKPVSYPDLDWHLVDRVDVNQGVDPVYERHYFIAGRLYGGGSSR